MNPAPMEFVSNANTDDVTCVCGNTPDTSGFYPYADGREVEPTPDDWDGVRIFCASCARVIDQNTGAVVEHPARILNIDGVAITADA